ncbi:MAG: type II toxin-antitoxin system HipA family toxin [Sulfurospirillum sp.]|nr:MAG: type II toxin-antitoxin system HipA family toxin [Sulfurospirillum sp.]
MAAKLSVFYKDQKVGIIQVDSKTEHFAFAYTHAWRQNGFEISPHIPFDTPATSASIKKFLDNLLPEGRALDIFSLFFQVTKNNTLAITREIGNETSGALTFFDDRAERVTTSERKIKEIELTERIRTEDPVRLIIWDGKPRLSVAGVQDKLPVIYRNGAYSFGEGKLASTHILKFETDRQRHLIINEYICMKLAHAAGLEAAEVEIKHFGDKPALLVTRFDRKRISDEEIERLHIIDGCQALDLPPTHKYERNMGTGKRVEAVREGVSFQKLFAFSNRCANPIKTKLQILQWAFFNLIISNADAHGKNISFFAGKNGYTLTPFYDMVCIAMYPEFEQQLSMGYGDNFSTDIQKRDIEAMCEQCDINPKLAFKELKNMANRVLKAVEEHHFHEAATGEEEKAFVKEMVKQIRERAERYSAI